MVTSPYDMESPHTEERGVKWRILTQFLAGVDYMYIQHGSENSLYVWENNG